MEHLSSHDYRLLCQNTFANQYTLDSRDTFLWNFNTQVTTGHHYTICHFQNFINIIYPFLILNLRNHLNITIMSM